MPLTNIFLIRLAFSLMPSAVAMPELHSYLRTRALRRQRGPLDTRSSCLHAGFYMLSLGYAAGYDSVNVIVGSTPECDSYRALTTASHHCKANNGPPIHLKVDYVLCDRLNSLCYGVPSHPSTTAPLSLAITTHDDASSGG
jgi:hypothetical protein